MTRAAAGLLDGNDFRVHTPVHADYNAGMAKNPETNIQNAALLAVGARQDVLAMRLQSGVFRSYDQPEKLVRVGQPGLADTMMIVAVEIDASMVGKTVGVAVAAEIKTASGKQSEAQRRWQRAFEQRGGVYEVVRSPDQMVDLVERVKRGEF